MILRYAPDQATLAGHVAVAYLCAMRMEKETIDRIRAIFAHMQLTRGDGVQQYDPEDEWRPRVAIGKYVRHDGSADLVYCHTLKLTPWQQRIWAKRQKEIPYRAFLQYYEDRGLYRLGFSTYQE